MNAEEAKAAKWNKTRQMGKAKYVMFYGVAGIGIGLTLLFTLVELISQNSAIPTWITTRLLVFSVIGFMFANFRWENNENKYGPRPGKKS